MYKVFDYFSNSIILETTDKQAAINCAYNHQCELYFNDQLIADYGS